MAIYCQSCLVTNVLKVTGSSIEAIAMSAHFILDTYILTKVNKELLINVFYLSIDINLFGTCAKSVQR